MQAMRFDEFARKLPTVFDTRAKQGDDFLVEKEGVLFRIEIKQTVSKPDIWADYDPEKIRQGLKRSAGALQGVDHEALKKDIHRLRQEDSPDQS
jgi:hypothetical protein